jgi:hypothetical protein
MPAPTTRHSLLPGLALLLALAGCSTSVQRAETAVPGQLPGPGTYTWSAAPPTLPEETPADTASRSATAPLSTAPMPAPADAAVKSAITRALDRRGYAERPEHQAAWRVSYAAIVEAHSENLAPRDKLLQPRMTCDLHDCRIQHQWEHFGPPLRGDPVRNFFVGVVQVQVHDARNGRLVWRGHLRSEVDERGELDRRSLDTAMRKLIRGLPSVPRERGSREESATAASGS